MRVRSVFMHRVAAAFVSAALGVAAIVIAREVDVMFDGLLASLPLIKTRDAGIRVE
jgi:hypothetical protein